MKKLSVVIPVYYNEESLPLLLRNLLRVEEQLAARSVGLELIFVDDGSGDASFLELMKIKQQRSDTRIIKLTRNFGAVHASKTGFQFVTGDCFMILAADLQDPPEIIIDMVDSWLSGSKFVICVRKDREDPVLTKAFAWVYYRLVSAMVSRSYPSSGFDLFLMDSAMLPHMQKSGKNINPNLFAHWLGFKPFVIRYDRRRRVHGRSRWTFAKKFKFFLDSLLGFSIVPIRLILLVGLIVSLLSFGYGSLIVINAVHGRTDVPGFATLAALIAFLFGLTIIILGMIGEYLWRVFDELNKRPEAVIDEIH